MKFGYKPHGRNDTTLLEIFITVVYIFACSGDSEGLEDALGNARSCLKLFNGFSFRGCSNTTNSALRTQATRSYKPPGSFWFLPKASIFFGLD